jgi:hypothetical protein
VPTLTANIFAAAMNRNNAKRQALYDTIDMESLKIDC